MDAKELQKEVNDIYLMVSTLFSKAREAINYIPGHGTVPSNLYLSASSLNQLAAALNAVE